MTPTSRAAFLRRVLLAYAGFAVSLAYCLWRIARWRLSGSRVDDRSHIARDTARVMSRLVCGGGDITVHVVNGDRIAAAQPCVYVANHQSFVDYPILATIFPARTAIVGKADIGRIPLIGWLFRLTGNVLLARDDERRPANTITQLVQIIRKEQRSVWMFPEGTRRRTAEAMLPFRSGAFRVAAAAGVPIVPIVVSSLKPTIDLAQRQTDPTTITIQVLPARTFADSDDSIRSELIATRDSMIAAYRDVSATTSHP